MQAGKANAAAMDTVRSCAIVRIDRLPREAPMDLPIEYETDFVSWTERQAAILRALPSGFQGLDTETLAEEVEDLGRAEIRAASSLLRQVLIHLIKIAHEPEAPAVSHWLTETLAFQAGALAAASSGVQQRIDLPKIWRTACKAALPDQTGRQADLLPAECPFTLAELLAGDLDVRALTQRLSLLLLSPATRTSTWTS